MAGVNRTTGKATDLITFSRASGGTALRKISYGSELAPSLSTAIKVGDAATTIAYNSGADSLDIDAATTLDGAILLVSGVVVGRVYLFTADITLGTCTDSRITVGPSYTNQARLQSSGTVSLVFTAEDTQIRIDSYTDTGTFTVNSISVKEVTFDQPSGTLTLFNHPTNIPRIEYDADGNVKGLLIEEARTNLVTYSNDFTNASWIKSTITVTADATASPTNEVDATRLTASNAFSNVGANVTLATGATYNLSVFLKADTTTQSALALFDATGAATEARVNIEWSSGVPSLLSVSGTAVDVSFQHVANGWYRVSFSGVADAVNTAHRFLIYPDTDAGSNAVLAYGAQLEAGSFATSYIPTSGATATRAADIASISVDNFGYRQDAGTVVVEFDTLSSSAGYIGDQTFATSVAYSSNRDFKTFNGTSGLATSNQFTLGEVAKGATAYNHSDRAVCLNGGAVASTSGAMQNVTTYKFGLSFVQNYLNGHIKSVTYYPRRLSNAQLQELTA